MIALRDLNHRFLDLAGRAPAMAPRATRAAGTAVAALSPAQRAAAAGCPYALFDLRFQDDGTGSCVCRSGSWRVADEPARTDETVGFVRLALFYAWHVAASAGLEAQLLLGMNGGTARRIPAGHGEPTAGAGGDRGGPPVRKMARLSRILERSHAAASRADEALRRIQLYGLQLAAAARLPDAARRRSPWIRVAGGGPRGFRLRGSYARPSPSPAHQDLQERRPGPEGHRPEVEQGDFFALLGPNGAGKTTLIGITTSLVNKTGGTVEVFGHDIDRNSKRPSPASAWCRRNSTSTCSRRR